MSWRGHRIEMPWREVEQAQNRNAMERYRRYNSSHFTSVAVADPAARQGGAEKHEITQAPLAAIFFITYFHRARGAWPPHPPWIHYWCRSTTHEQHVKFFHSLILFQQFFQIYELCDLLQNTSPRIPIYTWEKIENYFEKDSVHLIFSNEESMKIKRSRRTSCCRNAVHLYSQTNKTRKHTRTLKHSTQFLFSLHIRSM